MVPISTGLTTLDVRSSPPTNLDQEDVSHKFSVSDF